VKSGAPGKLARFSKSRSGWRSSETPPGIAPSVLREPHHAQLRDHDRPAKNRNDREEREDDFPGDSRVFEREGKAAGRQDDRK